MKIRRFAAFVVALCLMVSFAHAEDKKNSVVDAINEWLVPALDDASEWVSQAWDDASEVAGSAWSNASEWAGSAWKDVKSWTQAAWGDASEWIGQAWSDTSSWVTDNWGGFSAWASELYRSASGTVNAWWVSTFDSVTKAGKNAWDWVQEQTPGVKEFLVEKYNEVSDSAQKGLSDAEETLRNIFTDLLKELNISQSDILKTLKTILDYAKSKGISVVSLEKVLLPYMVRLAVESKMPENGPIPPVAVAQFLTGVIEKTGINSEGQATEFLLNLAAGLNND